MIAEILVDGSILFKATLDSILVANLTLWNIINAILAKAVSKQSIHNQNDPTLAGDDELFGNNWILIEKRSQIEFQ